MNTVKRMTTDNWVESSKMNIPANTPKLVINYPTETDLEFFGIKIGDSVKISNGVEPLFVKITGFVDDFITGIIDSEVKFPRFVKKYVKGDPVRFQRKNIITIIRGVCEQQSS